ncbi:HdeD family acid-resistance protein [Ancylobacter mangrovi]|uniref:HdeD family acid-resistance protein n=1 Tax=Ancylobacter mangrovi TaxID=2972472 RepID=A0A9X2P975_9HYPH|nr:HdeD family acid-resistance protein [Ancylobacter mangrovi]MCS0493690.1 HdeD family acid-resistance protein [Ancylobacter mangrovi]MCS0501692.1 HdeD family acid-resistance protein [Ancylobacter mangrovi]
MSTPSDSVPQTPAGSFASHLKELHAKWGWFVALGIIMIIAGVIALGSSYGLLLGTLISVYYIGAMMVVGGVAQIFHAFSVKGWGGFLFWLLDGILYLAAGALAFAQPDLAATVLTLLLGVALIVGGIFRLIAAFQMRPAPGWGWILFSAVIAILLGIEITVQWPINSMWILGLFLGVDLLFNGFTVLMLGLGLKR